MKRLEEIYDRITNEKYAFWYFTAMMIVLILFV